MPDEIEDHYRVDGANGTYCRDCQVSWPCLVWQLASTIADIGLERAQERAEAERTIVRLQAEVELLRSRP